MNFDYVSLRRLERFFSDLKTWLASRYASKNELPGTMTGASQQTAGSSGLVPAPAAGYQDKVLRGDGTWGDAANATVSYNAETGELHIDFSPQVNNGGN